MKTTGGRIDKKPTCVNCGKEADYDLERISTLLIIILGILAFTAGFLISIMI
jgi:hypothetical protein